MAQDSQVANVDLVSALGGLMHDIFVGDVVPNVRQTSLGAQMFTDARPGQYRLEGSNLVGAADFVVAQGAMASGGSLPDHVYEDAVQWQTSPTRRYRRIALDNHAVLRATSPGAFGDLAERVTNQLWASWRMMEIRHAYGSTNGYIGLCSARTDADTVVIKDALGHAGLDPGMFLRPGQAIAWVDVSATPDAIGGAGVISAVTSYAAGTLTVNITSSSTWEPSAQIAADDPIVIATTGDSTADYFDTEWTLTPHGFGSIIDPDSNFTTVLNIAEGDHPEWQPYKQASTTFDHIEVTEFVRKLRAKSTDVVTAQSHVMLTQGVVVAELARSLEAFNQQMNLGRTWEGGYQGVRIGQFEFAEDDYAYQDVVLAVSLDDLYRVNLGGDAHMWGDDGSQFSRLADYDGVEAFAVDYVQQFAPRRNRMGALTDIATTGAGYDFNPTPNY